mmetsp:Transcript_80080/g.158655  ORF Transcript_80080/g.158655 Transcript_80080/m.158655 type:complete len:101 (-) Transcript_80080:179-481(-)
MAAFTNSEIVIKVLQPGPDDKGNYYWGMVAEPAPKDLFKVKATSSMTVKELKATIAQEKGYAVDTQRLMLFGGELEDSRTLASCGYENTDDPLIHMIPRA